MSMFKSGEEGRKLTRREMLRLSAFSAAGISVGRVCAGCAGPLWGSRSACCQRG